MKPGLFFSPQASNLQEVQEVWEDFERQSEKVSDADQRRGSVKGDRKSAILL